MKSLQLSLNEPMIRRISWVGQKVDPGFPVTTKTFWPMQYINLVVLMTSLCQKYWTKKLYEITCFYDAVVSENLICGSKDQIKRKTTKLYGNNLQFILFKNSKIIYYFLKIINKRNILWWQTSARHNYEIIPGKE